MRAPPPVSAARPRRCPGCGRAACPAGGQVLLHGHGLRYRQLWGPPAPGVPAVALDFFVRRYRCQGCAAVITVAPRGVLRHHLYSSMAIAWALALYGIGRLSHPKVRAAVSPWRPSEHDPARTTWRTLPRWVDAVASGVLRLIGVPRPPARPRSRVAERLALVIGSHALGGETPLECAFWGASRLPR